MNNNIVSARKLKLAALVLVGVQISFPLRNHTAEAQLGRSLVEGERIATQREQLEQSIQVEVRNGLQSMRSAEARLRAAVATRRRTSNSSRANSASSMRDSRRRFSCSSDRRRSRMRAVSR
jgi:hypothetical protein